MVANKSQKVDDLIETLPEKNIKEITTYLRNLILETSEHIVEEVKWGMPSYSQNRNVCYLQPSKKHVNLGFYFGASLKDKENSLEGTGKKMRHIKIKNMEDIHPENIKSLIQKAIDWKA